MRLLMRLLRAPFLRFLLLLLLLLLLRCAYPKYITNSIETSHI